VGQHNPMWSCMEPGRASPLYSQIDRGLLLLLFSNGPMGVQHDRDRRQKKIPVGPPREGVFGRCPLCGVLFRKKITEKKTIPHPFPIGLACSSPSTEENVLYFKTAPSTTKQCARPLEYPRQGGGEIGLFKRRNAGKPSSTCFPIRRGRGVSSGKETFGPKGDP